MVFLQTGVEGYYDPTRKVVFLHLAGAYDTTNLMTALENMQQQLQEKVIFYFSFECDFLSSGNHCFFGGVFI